MFLFEPLIWPSESDGYKDQVLMLGHWLDGMRPVGAVALDLPTRHRYEMQKMCIVKKVL